MKLPVKLVMMSHLSDVQEGIQDRFKNNVLNFVKYLILNFPNTDVEIDADLEWDKFLKTRP